MKIKPNKFLQKKQLSIKIHKPSGLYLVSIRPKTDHVCMQTD